MKLRISLLPVLLGVLVVPAAAAPAAPSSSMVATIGGVIAAVNANDVARVNSYFATSSIVVDELPPYMWTGAAAGAHWWRAVNAFEIQNHISHLHATAGKISQWNAAGNTAYVVVPLDIASVAKGKPGDEKGLWALTLQRLGHSWMITSAAWATLR